MSSLTPERPRYMRRQWKQQKPYLSRSDSVPSLRLVEMGRKPSSCSSCGFALTNRSLPICVWCEVKLPDALVMADTTDSPNSRAYRMRRASEPLFKKRLWEERAGRARRIRIALSVSQFNAPVTAVNVLKAAPLTLVQNNPSVIKTRITERRRSGSSSSSIAPLSPSIQSGHSSSDSDHVASDPVRSLRRKKRFTPSSMSSTHTKTSSVSIPITEYSRHSRSKSHLSLDPAGRLGQPGRPYYTAIRNNMNSSMRASPPPPSAWVDTAVDELGGLNHRTSMSSSIASSTAKLKTQARKSFTSPRSSTDFDQEIELRAALARDLGSFENEEDFSRSREQSRKSRMSKFTRGIVDLLRK